MPENTEGIGGHHSKPHMQLVSSLSPDGRKKTLSESQDTPCMEARPKQGTFKNPPEHREEEEEPKSEKSNLKQIIGWLLRTMYAGLAAAFKNGTLCKQA